MKLYLDWPEIKIVRLLRLYLLPSITLRNELNQKPMLRMKSSGSSFHQYRMRGILIRVPTYRRMKVIKKMGREDPHFVFLHCTQLLFLYISWGVLDPVACRMQKASPFIAPYVYGCDGWVEPVKYLYQVVPWLPTDVLHSAQNETFFEGSIPYIMRLCSMHERRMIVWCKQ